MDNTTQHPFAPRGPLTPEQLRAYVEGHLDSAAQHEVELLLEVDPFAREAVEGLNMPGALAGLDALATARPNANGDTYWPYLAGGVLVLVIFGAVRWFAPGSGTQRNVQPLLMNDIPVNNDAFLQEAIPLTDEEVIAAVEIPESLHIGHAATDRHAEEMRIEVLVREVPEVERLANRTPTLDSVQPRDVPTPVHAKKHSLQLIYLHDLKLVDPSELYTTDPILDEGPAHLTADLADEAARQHRNEQQRYLHYTPFMDVAMEKFAHNDHRGCLEELRFLLAQYPDDVNALFYAGLCCYNLGLYDKAEKFLDRAATHTITVFDEEAVWYHALAMERNGKRDKAREVFQLIAKNDGFYAKRAQGRLGR